MILKSQGNDNNAIDTSNLVKKLTVTQALVKLKKKITDHDHAKYLTTQEFNKLTSENFASRLAQKNLVSKNVVNFIKETDFYVNLKNF